MMDSSSDEDVDILLRKASDKLGWSSKKNSEETIRMLRQNVKESKKKQRPCSSRRRRQTPRAWSKTATSQSVQPLTSKRTLSFKASPLTPLPPSQSKQRADDVNRDCSLLLEKLNFSDSVSHPNNERSEGSVPISESQECQNDQSKGGNSDGQLRSSEEDSPLPNVFLNDGGSPENFSISEVHSEFEPGDVQVPTGPMDGGGDSKGVKSSWADYREGDSKQRVLSDSEDAGRAKVIPEKDSAARRWSSDEDSEASDGLPSPPPSLSERLLKNFRDKKGKDGRNGGQPSSDDGAMAAEASRGTDHGRKGFTSSDDDAFETFLQKMKTPQKSKPNPSPSEDDDEDNFIDDGPISEAEEEPADDGPLFYYQQDNEGLEAGCIMETTSLRTLTDQTNKSTARSIIVLSSSSDDEVFSSPVKPKWTEKTRGPKMSTRVEALPPKTPINKPVEGKKRTFLGSLDTPPINAQSDSPYVKNFKKRRVELTAKLFAMYNETVFDSKLPSNMQVLWNKRMRKTAGYCVYTRAKLKGTRDVRIELSEKVCDTAERLRDTLIHEMCHAACWLINGVNDGHGRFWKYWASKANLAHPDLPVIKRCHSYEISTKFKYQCQQCKSIVGRHSKSLDVIKKCCGFCKGRFILLPTANGKENRKQQPNKFALFVKENYASIKKGNDCLKHADVMRMLSQEFSRKATLGD